MLTDAKIRKAAAREKDYKLADAHGLYVLVRANGSKLWRIKYRVHGKEKLLSLGPYPEVSLADAREQLADARKKLRAGEDPQRRRSSSLTFEALAREWHELQKPRWAERHAKKVLQSFENEVFPFIGQMSVDDIDPPTVLDVVRRMEKRGALEGGARVRQRISAVFVYGISSGRAKSDPAAIITGALAPPKPKGHRPALVNLDEIRELMLAVENSDSYPITILASRLLALSAARPGMIRGMRWDEIAGDIWTIPAERMKLLKEHKHDSERDFSIPITPQMHAVLDAARPLSGHLKLVFPGQRSFDKPLSDNALGVLYLRLNYKGRHVPHGWRSSFSTIMNERRPRDREVIDLMLAHVRENEVEAAYNRSQHWARRVAIAKEWSALISKGLPPPRTHKS